jgi:hypothetical protein
VQGEHALRSSFGPGNFWCETEELASSLRREEERRKDNEEVALCVVSIAYLFGSPE